MEPESLLPRTEQRVPQWISLKRGAQGTSGLTRDNIYPLNSMSCLEDCIHLEDCIMELTLEFLHYFPPPPIVLRYGYYDSRIAQDLFNNQLCSIDVYQDALINKVLLNHECYLSLGLAKFNRKPALQTWMDYFKDTGVCQSVTVQKGLFI